MKQWKSKFSCRWAIWRGSVYYYLCHTAGKSKRCNLALWDVTRRDMLKIFDLLCMFGFGMDSISQIVATTESITYSDETASPFEIRVLFLPQMRQKKSCESFIVIFCVWATSSWELHLKSGGSCKLQVPRHLKLLHCAFLGLLGCFGGWRWPGHTKGHSICLCWRV